MMSLYLLSFWTKFQYFSPLFCLLWLILFACGDFEPNPGPGVERIARVLSDNIRGVHARLICQ